MILKALAEDFLRNTLLVVCTFRTVVNELFARSKNDDPKCNVYNITDAPVRQRLAK